jgi:hypothetical protein
VTATDGSMTIHLSMVVPLRIAEIQRDLAQGADLSMHLARVSSFAQDIAEHGDHLLFPGKRTKELMVKVADALAVMAFLPGGVTLFGLHFEAMS